MPGMEIFVACSMFIQTEKVSTILFRQKSPPMIEELLGLSNTNMDAIDYFMFHQPNSFLLKQLQIKLGVDEERLPSNIVSNFGNPSAVSIPLCIVHNLGNEMTKKVHTICLAGFGTGLTWTSMLLKMGNMSFCEMIEYE